MRNVVLGFADIDQTQRPLVGGKGANLGELSRIEGVRVLDGVCISTEVAEDVQAVRGREGPPAVVLVCRYVQIVELRLIPFADGDAAVTRRVRRVRRAADDLAIDESRDARPGKSERQRMP